MSGEVTGSQVVAKIGVDLTQLKQGYQQAKDETNKQKSWFKSAMADMTGVVGGMLAAAGIQLGIQSIVGTMKDWIDSAEQAAENQRQLNAVLTSTHDAVGMSADQINNMVQQLKNLNGIDDDVILQGDNMLLTFTNIGSSVFPMATQAMLDMGVAMNNGSTQGLNLKDTAIQLGKALNDPIAGISALSRVGVTFTEDQKKQIKAMVDAGNTAGAQKLILQELEKEFGGVAKAAGDSDPLNRFKLVMGDIGKTIGGDLLPPLTDLADNVLTPLADWIGSHINPAMADMKNLLGDLKQKFLDAFNDPNGQKVAKLRDLAKDLKDKLHDLSEWIKNQVKPRLEDLATDAGNVASWLADLKQHVQDVHDWFVQWEPEITIVAGLLTAYFLPAIIKSGVEASVSAATITYDFVASIINSGREALIAAGKLWFNPDSMFAAFGQIGTKAKDTAGQVADEALAEQAAGDKAAAAAPELDTLAASEDGVGASAGAAAGEEGAAGGGGIFGFVAAIAALQMMFPPTEDNLKGLQGYFDSLRGSINLTALALQQIGESEYQYGGGGGQFGPKTHAAGGMVGPHEMLSLINDTPGGAGELVKLPSGSVVFPHNQSVSMLQQAQAPVSPTYTQNITIQNVGDADAIVRKLDTYRRMQKALFSVAR